MSSEDPIQKKSRVLAAIKYRRSVRNYSTRPIEPWKLDTILESARLAPSSNNAQPWKVGIIQDPSLRALLSESTPKGIGKFKWLKDAPVVLILSAKKAAFQKVAQIIGFHYHLIDMGIVGEHICLTAAELDLGTCWVGWINKKKIKKDFKLPASWEVVCLIALGYPKDTGVPKNFEQYCQDYDTASSLQDPSDQGIGNIGPKKRNTLEEIVFYDKYAK